MPRQSKNFTPEVEAFIEAKWKHYLDRELAELLLIRFGISVSTDVIKSLRGRRGWVATSPSEVGKRKGRMETLFPYAAKTMIAWLSPIMEDQDIIALIEKQFGLKRSLEQIKRWRHQNHLRNGKDGKFKPGNGPTKGSIKKGEHRGRATEFKKGRPSDNQLPVGTEVFLPREKLWKRKIAEPNKWQLRSRYVWEQANGPLNPGQVLIHIDGDSANDSLENLRVINRKILGRINSSGKHHGLRLEQDNKEWNNALISIAEIQQKIAEGAK